MGEVMAPVVAPVLGAANLRAANLRAAFGSSSRMADLPCAASYDLSRSTPPPLAGGYAVGEKLYYIAENKVLW